MIGGQTERVKGRNGEYNGSMEGGEYNDNQKQTLVWPPGLLHFHSLCVHVPFQHVQMFNILIKICLHDALPL